MSLIIGINEGWKLGNESKITEKGGLSLHFIKGEAITSALDLLESEEPDQEIHSLLLFPPNLTDYKTKEPRSAIEIMKDIRVTYKQLYKLFNLYLTKDELKEQFPVGCLVEDLGLTRENELTLLTQEPIVNKMFANMAEAALGVIENNSLWEKEDFRIKMLRQSPKKAFPRLTYKPDFGDWVELMSVPAAQSKVEFTAFEKSRGYDDPTIATDPVDQGAEAAAFDEETTVEDEIPSAAPDDVAFDEEQ